MKKSTPYLMMIMPAIYSFIYFGCVELFFLNKSLWKGALFSVPAFLMILICLAAYINHSGRLTQENKGRIYSFYKYSCFVNLILLVVPFMIIFSHGSWVLLSGVCVVNSFALLNLIALLKLMGGQTMSKDETSSAPNSIYSETQSTQPMVNPASGMPMIGGVSGLDVSGNSWGTNNDDM